MNRLRFTLRSRHTYKRSTCVHMYIKPIRTTCSDTLAQWGCSWNRCNFSVITQQISATNAQLARASRAHAPSGHDCSMECAQQLRTKRSGLLSGLSVQLVAELLVQWVPARYWCWFRLFVWVFYILATSKVISGVETMHNFIVLPQWENRSASTMTC